MSGDAKAKVYKVTANGKTYAHIKFYTSNESETYAEVCRMLFLSLFSLIVPFILRQFVAEDPVRTFFPFLLGLTENL
jgi:hypothetical protein